MHILARCRIDKVRQNGSGKSQAQRPSQALPTITPAATEITKDDVTYSNE